MIRTRLRGVTAVLMMLLVAAGPSFGADEFCWRSTKTRGAGIIPSDCEYSQEKQGLLCYSKCPAGSVGVGPVCWQTCPAGFVDNGIGCTKPAPQGRGAGFAWQAQDGISNEGMLARCSAQSGGKACEMWGAMAYPVCNAGLTPFGANICSPVCPAGFADVGVSCLKPNSTRAPITAKCPAGTVYEDGLCYKACESGYSGVGPVCWGQCPADKPIPCGGGCAADGSKKPGGGTLDVCATLITDQVTSVTGMITDIVLTVASAGGYSGIKAATKQAIKKTTKFVSEKTSQQIAKKGVEMVLDTAKGYVKDQVKGKFEEIILTEAQNNAVTLIDPTAETASADFEWTDLDPTGIADIVNAYNHPTCAPPPPGTVVAGPKPTDDIPLPLPKKGVWQAVPLTGTASDVAVTDNGTVYMVGGLTTAKGRQVLRRRPQDSGWTLLSGSTAINEGAARIAVGRKRIAMVNSQGEIAQSVDEGRTWQTMKGWASDVAVDTDDNLFVLGNSGSVWVMKAGEDMWRALPGLNRNQNLYSSPQPLRIAATGREQVVISAPEGSWSFDSANSANPWKNISPGGSGRLDVAMTEDGSVLEAVGGQPLRSLSPAVNLAKPQAPQAQSVAVGGGWVWIVDWQGGVRRIRI
jgi:hypothetical protein